MNQIKKLKPSPVWNYFTEICNIPRLSNNEEKIRRWLIEFARKRNLEYHEDGSGNLLIIREAAPGYATRKTVVLQSHLDMVGEKDSDHPHNWFTDPIIPVLRGEWVAADGTTLGADDGIGIATQMAVLDDKNIRAGRIECLFTVNEEAGMTGAKNISPDFIQGRTLINLDSEDEGILFIGCAGGIDTVGEMKYSSEEMPPGKIVMKLSLTGLTGGHSGDEIHKGFANSIKQMARLLLSLTEKYDIKLADFNGGNLRNGIPREAFALITARQENVAGINEEVNHFRAVLIEEYGKTDPGMLLEVSTIEYNGAVIGNTDRDKLISLLLACPHGVISWSRDMADLVETSTNLAIISCEKDNNTINIITTQRSSLESEKQYAAEMVASCIKLAGAVVSHPGSYPGWKPDINSEILNISRSSYKKLFGREPEVKSIHAGLECGLFYQKFPGIDMISFGPTIRGAHTPEEKIEVKTVAMFWDLLIDILKSIPEK